MQSLLTPHKVQLCAKEAHRWQWWYTISYSFCQHFQKCQSNNRIWVAVDIVWFCAGVQYTGIKLTVPTCAMYRCSWLSGGNVWLDLVPCHVCRWHVSATDMSTVKIHQMNRNVVRDAIVQRILLHCPNESLCSKAILTKMTSDFAVPVYFTVFPFVLFNLLFYYFIICIARPNLQACSPESHLTAVND